MRDRPWYVAILCWSLIVVNAWKLIHSFALINDPGIALAMQAIPVPIPVQWTQYFLSMIVPLVTAMFMCEGFNWARVTYIGWGIANYLYLAIVVPDRRELQPAVWIFAITAILLLLPRPRGYFLLERHHS